MICVEVGAQTPAVPYLVNYQGRLTDQNGQALADGTYGLAFRIWPTQIAQGGEVLVWGASYQVAVAGGSFNVILGAAGGTAITPSAVNDLGFAFSSSTRFIELQVLTDNSGVALAQPQTIAPRQQVLSTPYAAQAQNAVSAVSALNGVPPGTILPYGGSSAPFGYLMCDGTLYSRETYPNLAAVLSTPLGAATPTGAVFGGSATMFNVPDFRGRFLRGADGGTGRDQDVAARTAMATGGNDKANIGSIQADAFRNHNHTGLTQDEPPIPSDGSLTPVTIRRPWIAYSNSNTQKYTEGGMISYNMNAARGNHQHAIPADGGSETRPVNASVNYIIKY